ncbi:MAG: CoB--CoM heterodisulfide reductase iron-sulfur subunit A family protein, partial [Deltaproteobacteria bacterium]|nr:CoB--CoM heterodisulfide reductase iron-sulfur subunit A family protein [Deltaproteobacteria bacterium]
MPGNKTFVVIGGGMSGMTVALEAAETGARVHLVEEGYSLGGRVAQLARYFPKMCPPSCGIEINYRRLRKNTNVEIHTLTRMTAISGKPGSFEVAIETAPRFVNADCTTCGDCIDACPAERDNAFNYGMDKTKAIFLPHPMAYPMIYAVDRAACETGCAKCVDACKYGAVNLDEKPSTETIKADAVVVATGWKPYDATKLEQLGFGKYDNVITNVMMERMLAEDGPTSGNPVKPSDGEPPKKIAYVQCAGSRDRKHLPYCSAVCCGASMKETIIVRESNADIEQTIFYIDRRVIGRNEDVLARVEADEKTHFQRGKVAKITQDPTTHVLTLHAEDTETGKKVEAEADLVVLATGMV